MKLLKHLIVTLQMWLGFQKLQNIDQFYERIKTPTLKTIVKLEKHPSAIAINHSFANESFFL